MITVEQFPFCDRNPASGGVDLMPDLPVVLRHQTTTISTAGLLDSGASISVLPYRFGVQLGFDWNTQKGRITVNIRGQSILSVVEYLAFGGNSDSVAFLAWLEKGRDVMVRLAALVSRLLAVSSGPEKKSPKGYTPALYANSDLTGAVVIASDA